MKRAIVLPDIHVPYHDKRTLAAVEAYMADYRWNYWIQLGDFMDFDQISHWNKGLPGNVVNKTVAKDYREANAVLDRQQAILHRRNPEVKMSLLSGNHEGRVTKYLAEHPELKGTIEVPISLRLKERGIRWIDFWDKGEVLKIGNAHFIHGVYTGNNHAKRHVENFGVNVYYGHTHDVMSWPKVLRGNDKTIEAHSLGCLSRYDLPYLNGRPTNWQQCFGVFHFFDDGFYNMYAVRIFKHRFVSPEGRVYG